MKKWILIENLIQLFGSKMDVDWIIKNPIHDHPYEKCELVDFEREKSLSLGKEGNCSIVFFWEICWCLLYELHVCDENAFPFLCAIELYVLMYRSLILLKPCTVFLPPQHLNNICKSYRNAYQ